MPELDRLMGLFSRANTIQSNPSSYGPSPI